ncbi:MAG TPA: hypothetical protein VNT25_01815 [Allosphingosinicella sp.]|nr:hypothetical protein [Allosphingosinicella sp.]
MLRSIVETNGEHFAHNPAHRGFAPVYRENKVNQCPGCGRTQWYVGRISAECCFCATALPLSEHSVVKNGRHVRENRPVFFQSSRG